MSKTVLVGEPRHPDFEKIFRQFMKRYCGSRTVECQKGKTVYYAWLNKLGGLDDTKPYVPQGQHEKFSWIQPFQVVKRDRDTRYYKVEAAFPLSSMNQNVYTEQELLRAARTLIGKPVNINHETHVLKGVTIEDAEYEDGAVEVLLKVLRNAGHGLGFNIQRMIETEEIINVSIEASCQRGVTRTPEGGKCEGLNFTGLALLTKDTLPGVPLTRIEPVEKIVESFENNMEQDKCVFCGKNNVWAYVGICKKCFDRLVPEFGKENFTFTKYGEEKMKKQKKKEQEAKSELETDASQHVSEEKREKPAAAEKTPEESREAQKETVDKTEAAQPATETEGEEEVSVDQTVESEKLEKVASSEEKQVEAAAEKPETPKVDMLQSLGEKLDAVHEEINSLSGKVETIIAFHEKDNDEDKAEDEAHWTTQYINDLPDSSFAYIQPGGKKDDQGKTAPRTLRNLPFKDAQGNIDLPHLRNALARLPQTSLSAQAKTKSKQALCAAAKKVGLKSRVCGTEEECECEKKAEKVEQDTVEAKEVPTKEAVIERVKQLREEGYCQRDAWRLAALELIEKVCS